MKAFATTITEDGNTLVGPWRQPRQMLANQSYDGHASIHDNSTAQKLGFKAATIEGPTHFSQFDPLCERLWGETWFETGCISAHYRNAVFAGEEVQATASTLTNADNRAIIRMTKRDGTEVLTGTASVGREAGPTALDLRLTELKPIVDPVILYDVKTGTKTARQTVRMEFDQNMGHLYPFSLRDKLKAITEPSWLYDPERSQQSKWKRPIIPLEMLSVLFQYTSLHGELPVKGPVVGLFADQEIRLLNGPLFVGERYQLERQVVLMTGSRRTESLWLRTTVYAEGTENPVATMLLNLAHLKESFTGYAREYARLYGT
jgi:hypothetical protein